MAIAVTSPSARIYRNKHDAKHLVYATKAGALQKKKP
jgi:hypothetical protein